jgi:hypothetical protein
VRAFAEEEIQRLCSIARDFDPVRDAVLLEDPKRQLQIGRVILHQQDLGFAGIKHPALRSE